MLIDALLSPLFSVEFRGRLARYVLEHAGEVLRIFEAEAVGDLGDGLPAENLVLGTMDDETADVVLGTFTQGTAHDVAEIAG